MVPGRKIQDGRIAAIADQEQVSSPAAFKDAVIPRVVAAGHDHVVAVAACHGVVAAIREDHVALIRCHKNVVPPAAGQDISAAAPFYRVIADMAAEDVVTQPADDQVVDHPGGRIGDVMRPLDDQVAARIGDHDDQHFSRSQIVAILNAGAGNDVHVGPRVGNAVRARHRACGFVEPE